jgi:hypothetical protein
LSHQERPRYYHGTARAIQNNQIEPGHEPHAFTGDPQGLVFFADNIEFADFWGSEGGMLEDMDYHVYEVAPIGPIRPDRGVASGQVGEGNFQSEYPLRIIRKVA